MSTAILMCVLFFAKVVDSDIICGPFFVAGDGDTDFISLTDAQVAEYQELFGNPEQFREYEPDAQPRAWIISF